MKNSFFSILVIIMLVCTGAGCATVSEQGSSTKYTDDQLFEKKQECASYKKEIEKSILEKEFSRRYTEIFDEVFFSPVLNTCLYSFKEVYSYSTNLGTNYIILDYLTGKQIYSKNSKVDDSIPLDAKNPKFSHTLFEEEKDYYKNTK